MPIYEYRCDKCIKTFEKLVFGSDEILCPKCGGTVQRIMSCCNFNSANGDFKTSGSGKSSCTSCTSSSCSTCH
jgi:putative FmdB family regulatory protein